jgi:predicted transposase YbfD/YdcC
METESSSTIVSHFSVIKDPRVTGRSDHKLIDIIVIAICGMICGCDDWIAIEDFGKIRYEWFKKFLELPNGIASHDTFGRVFSLIAPKHFQECFLSWIRSVAKISGGEIIPIDGKTLRRSHDSNAGKAAIHMVSAWAAGNRLVLGQVKTEEKSNEITAIPELLRLLDIKGCIVTIDAMGCQKKIAKQIIEQGGDYVLGLKGNQEALLTAVEEVFAQAGEEALNGPEFDFFLTEEKGHGRHEIRSHYTTSFADAPIAQEWEGLKTIGIVVSEREVNGQKSEEHRYYISSLKNDAEGFAKAIRAHWGIENSLHWVLDVAFREDDSRVRKGHAPENLAVLRHIALNLIRQEKTAKLGVKNRRLKAGYDSAYLAKVVFGQ